MMGRQHGANLWSGMHHENNRSSKKTSFKSDNESNRSNNDRSSFFGQKDEIVQRLKEIRDVTTLKDWRNGITGSIQFSTKVIFTREQENRKCDTSSSCQYNNCTSCSANNDVTSNDEQDQGDGQERQESIDKFIASSLPTQNPLNGTAHHGSGVVSTLPTIIDGDKNSSKSSPAIHSKTGVFLCLEIEKCLDLKISAVSQFNKRRRYKREGVIGKEQLPVTQKSLLCPFVLIKLNDQEVGRSPALKNTTNPVWYDECFQFPICEKCTDLTLEVWEEIPTNNGNNSRKDGQQQLVGEFVGKCNLKVQNILNKEVVSDDGVHKKFQEYNLQLRRWFDTPPKTSGNRNGDYVIPFEYGRSNPCSCPSKEEEKMYETVHTPLSRRETVRVQPTVKSFRRKRKRLPSILVEKPDNTSSTKNNFKIDNPEPYRRKDIREMNTEGDAESLIDSTYFKALFLMIIYLLIGVVGFSYMFESWTIRDSVYFSVVTFSTVGYGDIRPSSDGAKLFTCVFALIGIGIIGIALGFIGQNLVQAQIAALQRSQRRKEDSMTESKELMKPLPLVRNILLFICPIALMTIFGSIVVGTYEKWNVIDSIYWCVMTGTSVGYGDFAPRTNEMRWFSVVFIPLSVGCTSAALGRIANVFVEQEISKANTKLLKREVTLEDLEVMNADGDGEVSPLEFIEYMLKVMHKVDQNLLDELHAQFEKLDADGSGGLQQDDLELLTERKLKERRQQAIERYRSSLLNENDGQKLRRWSCPQIIPNG